MFQDWHEDTSPRYFATEVEMKFNAYLGTIWCCHLRTGYAPLPPRYRDIIMRLQGFGVAVGQEVEDALSGDRLVVATQVVLHAARAAKEDH